MKFALMSKTWLKQAIKSHRSHLRKERRELRKIAARLRRLEAALRQKGR